jgi:hypothetical protein
MVISPRPAAVQPATNRQRTWTSRFEARTLDDIRALGRNSEADDRAFAAVARMSEFTHSIYRMFWQPAIRAMVTQPGADLIRTLNPLRLSYTAFADSNPIMKAVEELAVEVRARRSRRLPRIRFCSCRSISPTRSSLRWMPTGTHATGWRRRCFS